MEASEEEKKQVARTEGNCSVIYIYHILLPALRILAGSLTGTVA